MESARDDFYVEDEPIEDVQRDWRSGEPVLIIPSKFRRQIIRAVRWLRERLADELRHAADYVGTWRTTGRS